MFIRQVRVGYKIPFFFNIRSFLNADRTGIDVKTCIISFSIGGVAVVIGLLVGIFIFIRRQRAAKNRRLVMANQKTSEIQGSGYTTQYPAQYPSQYPPQYQSQYPSQYVTQNQAPYPTQQTTQNF